MMNGWASATVKGRRTPPVRPVSGPLLPGRAAAGRRSAVNRSCDRPTSLAADAWPVCANSTVRESHRIRAALRDSPEDRRRGCKAAGAGQMMSGGTADEQAIRATSRGRLRRGRRRGRAPRGGGLPGPGQGRRAAAGRRAAGVRARRDDEPAADLGPRLLAAGGDVRGGGAGRRARGAARLLPRPRRGAGLALGDGRGRADAADDRHRLPRRADPDRARARACRARGGEAAGGGAGLCRGRDGGGRRPALRARGRARGARHAGVHVPRGARPGGGATPSARSPG